MSSTVPPGLARGGCSSQGGWPGGQAAQRTPHPRFAPCRRGWHWWAPPQQVVTVVFGVSMVFTGFE
eukprot:3590566-Pyramimonas_sp.AAC.1